MAAITATNSGPITQLVPFSIRNGDLSVVRPVFVRPSIPASYHWVPVRGMLPAAALRCVGAFIRSAFAQLGRHPVAGLTAAQIRKVAIALGVTRAVATAYYELSDQDLMANEVDSPIYSLSGAGAVTTIDPPLVDAAHTARAQQMTDLTDQERAAVATLLSSSLGSIPLQGYSLMMTQHHYLSAVISARRPFEAVEKQFWQSTAAGDWFTADLDLVRDICWHKGTHPVSIELKDRMARFRGTRAMLEEAGCGSAASRLPAEEGALKTARTYMVLVEGVMPIMTLAGGSLDVDTLTEAISFAEALPAWQPVNMAMPPRPPGMPTTIADRRSALQYLSQVCKSNESNVAFCYGFYMKMMDQAAQTAVGPGAVVDTLARAYSLNHLRTKASFTEGSLSYGDYLAVRTKARQKGQYQPPVIKFT